MEAHCPRRVDDGEVRRHGDKVSAGTLFTHLAPALAKAGPLPSTNNVIEGGVNSQPGAVLRNHRGPTSVKRVKAVFRWCHAHCYRYSEIGQARQRPTAIRATANYPTASPAAPPSRAGIRFH